MTLASLISLFRSPSQLYRFSNLFGFGHCVAPWRIFVDSLPRRYFPHKCSAAAGAFCGGLSILSARDHPFLSPPIDFLSWVVSVRLRSVPSRKPHIFHRHWNLLIPFTAQNHRNRQRIEKGERDRIFPTVSAGQFLNPQKMGKGCRNQEASSEMSAEVLEYRQQCSTMEGKGKRLWKKVKYQLVEYHSLPDYLRDNEYIHGHYRAEWPMKQVLLSIFSIHNETLNVWTHLIGFFIFLALTIYTAMMVPKVVDIHSLHLPEVLSKADLHKIQSQLMTHMTNLHKLRESSKGLLPSMSNWHIMDHFYNCLPERFSHNHTDVCVLRTMKEDLLNMITPSMTRPITRWPFFAFMGGAMFCLLASSACHLLSCHSKRMSYIMLRFDYAGIAALISTSFYPIVYYSFMCDPFFRNLYMGVITLVGITTILFSLLPVFQKPEFRTIRASLFFGMGFSAVAPIMHKLFRFWNQDQPEVLHTAGYELLMGTFYGVGALVYATRIPERWKPGKFDIAGHSHQLFHVLVVAGAYTHYRAGLIYLKWRDTKGC